MKSIIFWQNIPSIHQAPMIKELAKNYSGKVLVVTEFDVSSERIKQGWNRPDFSPADIIISPSRKIRKEIIRHHSSLENIHIFSGLHAYPETYWTLKNLSNLNTIIGVFMEAGRSDDGIKPIFRRVRYMINAIIWNKRIDFILATGGIAVNYYKKCGFSAEKIYPFAYFVEKEE